MTPKQMATASLGAGWRTAALIVALAAALGGLAAFVGPFVSSAPPWRWKLREEADLAGAAVNAKRVSIDRLGVRLIPQGDRHISIISPPLALPEDSNRVLTIQACRPDVADGLPVETTVRLLWQTEPVAQYRFDRQMVLLDGHLTEIRFSLPCPPSEIHRLGVQFPDVRDAVLVRSIGLPDLSLAEKLALAWQQLNTHEPIANHSINFLLGPQILGHCFNYFLLSGLLAAVGIYGFVRVARGRQASYRVLAGVALAVWLLADGQATKNLSRQVHAETEALRGRSWHEQIALINGPEIAWAYVQLLEQAQPGATYAVVSDDSFTPSHRLAYLLAPQRTLRGLHEAVDFIVVMGAADAVFDEDRRVFRWKEYTWTPAEKIAALSPGVYLLRRTAP